MKPRRSYLFILFVVMTVIVCMLFALVDYQSLRGIVGEGYSIGIVLDQSAMLAGGLIGVGVLVYLLVRKK